MHMTDHFCIEFLVTSSLPTKDLFLKPTIYSSLLAKTVNLLKRSLKGEGLILGTLFGTVKAAVEFSGDLDNRIPQYQKHVETCSLNRHLRQQHKQFASVESAPLL